MTLPIHTTGVFPMETDAYYNVTTVLGTTAPFQAFIKDRDPSVITVLLRFYYELDADRPFPGASGYVFCDIGDIVLPYPGCELALYNPSPGPAFPTIQLRTTDGLTTVVHGQTPTIKLGERSYLEVYASIPNRTVKIWHDDPATPDVVNDNTTVGGGSLDRIRFGLLRYLGTADAVTHSLFISSIAGLDNPDPSDRIGPGDLSPDPLTIANSPTHGIQGSLHKDYIAYQTNESPRAVWQKNPLRTYRDWRVLHLDEELPTELRQTAPVNTLNRTVYVATANYGTDTLLISIDGDTGAPTG